MKKISFMYLIIVIVGSLGMLVPLKLLELKESKMLTAEYNTQYETIPDDIFSSLYSDKSQTQDAISQLSASEKLAREKVLYSRLYLLLNATPQDKTDMLNVSDPEKSLKLADSILKGFFTGIEQDMPSDEYTVSGFALYTYGGGLAHYELAVHFLPQDTQKSADEMSGIHPASENQTEMQNLNLIADATTLRAYRVDGYYSGCTFTPSVVEKYMYYMGMFPYTHEYYERFDSPNVVTIHDGAFNIHYHVADQYFYIRMEVEEMYYDTYFSHEIEKVQGSYPTPSPTQRPYSK